MCGEWSVNPPATIVVLSIRTGRLVMKCLVLIGELVDERVFARKFQKAVMNSPSNDRNSSEWADDRSLSLRAQTFPHVA